MMLAERNHGTPHWRRLVADNAGRVSLSVSVAIVHRRTRSPPHSGKKACGEHVLGVEKRQCRVVAAVFAVDYTAARVVATLITALNGTLCEHSRGATSSSSTLLGGESNRRIACR